VLEDTTQGRAAPSIVKPLPATATLTLCGHRPEISASAAELKLTARLTEPFASATV
jgi:hypothetical protein